MIEKIENSKQQNILSFFLFSFFDSDRDRIDYDGWTNRGFLFNLFSLVS